MFLDIVFERDNFLFPYSGLLPGTISCNILSYSGTRLGSVNLEIVGPTQYQAEVVDSMNDPLKVMCDATGVECHWNSLDEKLSNMAKEKMPLAGFERLFGTDQVTRGKRCIHTVSSPLHIHVVSLNHFALNQPAPC